jgi:hypothetical protein
MGGAPKVNFCVDETSERRPQRSQTTVQAALLRLDVSTCICIKQDVVETLNPGLKDEQIAGDVQEPR